MVRLDTKKEILIYGLRDKICFKLHFIYEQALQSSCEVLIRQIEWLKLHAILKPWKTFGSLR